MFKCNKRFTGALKTYTQAFWPSTIIKDIMALTLPQVTYLVFMLLGITTLSLYWEDSAIGIVASATGVLCVFLVNMRKLSSFFWGILNCALYGYVAYTASLYGDTMLNWFFYLPFQFIGAVMWTRMMDGDSVISKKVDKPSTLFIIMVLAFTVAAIYSQALSSIGGALTPVDATTTVLSIIATCFMVKGYREQWVCWIIVNLLSIYMWSMTIINTGEGVGVLVMWVMFLSNSIYGTYTWFKASQSQETK